MRSSKPLEIGPAASLRAPGQAPPQTYDQAPAKAGDASPKAYDQRLFVRGPDGGHRPSRAGWLRGCARRLYVDHHLSRFRWLEREVTSLGLRSASVVELGCFDGRTIDHIPIEITRYVGLDAGWESGLVDGREVGSGGGSPPLRGRLALPLPPLRGTGRGASLVVVTLNEIGPATQGVEKLGRRVRVVAHPEKVPSDDLDE